MNSMNDVEREKLLIEFRDRLRSLEADAAERGAISMVDTRNVIDVLGAIIDRKLERASTFDAAQARATAAKNGAKVGFGICDLRLPPGFALPSRGDVATVFAAVVSKRVVKSASKGAKRRRAAPAPRS